MRLFDKLQKGFLRVRKLLAHDLIHGLVSRLVISHSLCPAKPIAMRVKVFTLNNVYSVHEDASRDWSLNSFYESINYVNYNTAKPKKSFVIASGKLLASSINGIARLIASAIYRWWYGFVLLHLILLLALAQIILCLLINQH